MSVCTTSDKLRGLVDIFLGSETKKIFNIKLIDNLQINRPLNEKLSCHTG